MKKSSLKILIPPPACSLLSYFFCQENMLAKLKCRCCHRRRCRKSAKRYAQKCADKCQRLFASQMSVFRHFLYVILLWVNLDLFARKNAIIVKKCSRLIYLSIALSLKFTRQIQIHTHIHFSSNSKQSFWLANFLFYYYQLLKHANDDRSGQSLMNKHTYFGAVHSFLLNSLTTIYALPFSGGKVLSVFGLNSICFGYIYFKHLTTINLEIN